ncbi:MAG: SRPBCC domain-containing protein, partial [Myxococcaceae bacterium]
MSDTIDKEQKTVSFERILSASPEAVFDAWTQPEQISKWWDPTGAPLVSCAIDLKPKGSFRFVTAGHAPPFEGVYEVIDRPKRLQFDAMGAKGTVTLRSHAQGTLMNVSIKSPSQEHFEMFVKLGV